MISKAKAPTVGCAVDLYQCTAGWVSKKVRELSVDELLLRPIAGRSHLYWIYGHIVLNADIAPFIDGSPAIIPKRYVELFDYGTHPKDTAADYPPIVEMLDLFDRAIERAVKALGAIGDHDLVKPPAVPLPPGIAAMMPTRYDVVMGLGLHQVYHAGQIGMILKTLDKGVDG